MVLCCYVCVTPGAKNMSKKEKKTNCVQVFYLKKKNNKLKMVQAHFLFINFTFSEKSETENIQRIYINV